MKYKKSVYTTLALISQIGISMIVPILLCTYVGAWLEEKYAFPFTIIFIVLGILAGGRNVFVLMRQAIQKAQEESDEEE